MTHRPTISPLTLLGALVLTLAAGAAASSQEARIEGLSTRMDDERLLVSCRLVGAFDEAFEQRLRSGIPTPLVYRFVLERDRRRWFDQSVDSSRLQIVAMFNAVTSEYLINFKHNGTLIESRVVRDLDQLRGAMTELADFPAFPLEERRSEVDHRLRVRVELGTRTVLALIPRTEKTPWARSDRLRFGG
ncbi:MAG: DUF4390 domain-containing protein [Acidobacteriota bacterium]